MINIGTMIQYDPTDQIFDGIHSSTLSFFIIVVNFARVAQQDANMSKFEIVVDFANDFVRKNLILHITGLVVIILKK
jgi:hypothetical protein